jgi:hypothetical protein
MKLLAQKDARQVVHTAGIKHKALTGLANGPLQAASDHDFLPNPSQFKIHQSTPFDTLQQQQ